MKQRIKALKDQLVKLELYKEDGTLPDEVIAKILMKSSDFREVTNKMYEIQKQYDQGLLSQNNYEIMMDLLMKKNDEIITSWLKKDLTKNDNLTEKTIKELEEISKMSLGDEE